MVKLELKEIIYVHKIISEQDIKGADAPFIANILGKLTNEANRIQKEIKPTPKVE
jgi:hypothetical protein